MPFNREIMIRLFGEFCATSMMMFFIPIACVETVVFSNNLLKTSLGYGLTLGITYQIFSCVSGAHVNPMVSLANYILGLMSLPMLGMYIVSQFVGTVMGYCLFMVVMPWDVVSDSPGLTVPHAYIGDGHALGMEFLTTSTIVLFWCSVWDPINANLQDGISLKVTHLVTLIVLCSGHYTAASFNPFRTLIPAIFQNNYTRIWIYFVSQPLATVVMTFAWKYLFLSTAKTEEKATPRKGEGE